MSEPSAVKRLAGNHHLPAHMHIQSSKALKNECAPGTCSQHFLTLTILISSCLPCTLCCRKADVTCMLHTWGWLISGCKTYIQFKYLWKEEGRKGRRKSMSGSVTGARQRGILHEPACARALATTCYNSLPMESVPPSLLFFYFKS